LPRKNVRIFFLTLNELRDLSLEQFKNENVKFTDKISGQKNIKTKEEITLI